MNKINNILNDNTFKEYVKIINEKEVDRVYCLHGIEHSLDVARIAHIINLEEGLKVDKEVIYAMALLHDIGRLVEYENGTPHHKASAEIARPILENADFDKEQIDIICQAIASHKTDESSNAVGRLLYRADKLSRNCFCCKAYKDCYWDETTKNKGIQF